MRRLLFLLSVFAFPLLADAKVYIDISSPAAKKLPIAIPNLNGDGETASLASKLAEIITNDLEVSSIFRIIDKSSYPDGPLKAELLPEKTDFKPWIAIGAEALVKGKATVIKQNMTVDARLYDVTTGKQVMASRYTGDKKETRKIAHAIADDIISAITGEKGIFKTRIAFVYNDKGGKEIFAMDYDGEGVEAVTQNGSINLSPSWSPDGSALAYVSYKDGKPAVYIRELKSGIEIKLSIPNGTSLGASWAPDGQKLAIVISMEGNAEIYTINRDGRGLARLTNNWGLDVSPSWSPDGKEIAFVSDRGGSPQIYIMDSSGGNVRRITYEGKYNASPSWSPKGDKIAFAGMKDGKFDIFSINPDGSGLAQLTVNAGSNNNPTWSPDGRFISFTSTRDDGYNIYLMKSNGGDQKRITSMKGKATAPNWGPRIKEPQDVNSKSQGGKG